MPEKLMKITYEGQAGAKKFNAYLRMPSQVYAVLRREIDMYLFQERQLPKIELRTFWIDTDGDEIEIINQNDYEVFLRAFEGNMHLQIAAVEPVVETKTASASCSTDDPSNFVIHDNVECDSCGINPLVGFRYKCIECPNFDLCQGCESSHKHSEHMMVRMPTNNCPSVLSWLSGPGHCKRSSTRRHQRAQCPLFTESPQAASSQQAAEGEFIGHKGSRRERRHSRRHGGVISQFLEMMVNMPENTPLATPTSSAAAPKVAEEEPAPSAPTAEPKIAAEAGSNVQETPKTAEPVAAPRCSKDTPEPSSAQTEAVGGATSTPSTPVINLENLSQIVPPEYMRAGIEILNNFSEMFAKMIDPSETGGVSETSTASSGAASHAAEAAADAATAAAKAATAAANATVAAAGAAATATASVANATATSTLPKASSIGTPVSVFSSSSTSTESSLENAPLLSSAPLVNEQQPKNEPERRRSDSLDHDWQLIDNSGAPANGDTLINLETSTEINPTPVAAQSSAPPATTPNFSELGELLRQHITEEQQREQATAHTQTSQVDTVTTSTSTTAVPTNTTGTSPVPPEERRGVTVYHQDKRINSSIQAMMAMGFSNEGAWLTQLMESVQGNIPAAIDRMHIFQNRN